MGDKSSNPPRRVGTPKIKRGRKVAFAVRKNKVLFCVSVKYSIFYNIIDLYLLT